MTPANADPCQSDTASVTPTCLKESLNKIDRSLCSMSLSDLALLKLLSTGGSGKVFLAKDNVRSLHLAVKIIPKSGHPSNSSTKVITEQAVQRMLTESDDARFLPLVSSWHDSANFYLATTYFQGGDMSVELMRCRRFDEERARFYVAELVIALRHLHSKKVIHRDFKPSNILFDPEGHLILADYGAARCFDECVGTDVDTDSGCFVDDEPQPPSSPTYPRCLTTEDCGTPLFMAPEQHLRAQYSFEVDYWALAVMLYRMLTGEMPFGQCASSKREIRRCVLHDPLIFPDNCTMSREAQDFIQRSLEKDRADRIPIADIPSHSFFSDVNWSAIESRTAPTPWKPFLRPVPTSSRTTIPIEAGTPYSKESDPYPDFSWCSPFQTYSLQPEATQEKVIRKCRSLPLRGFSTSHTPSRTTALPDAALTSKEWTPTSSPYQTPASPLTSAGSTSPMLLTPPPPYAGGCFADSGRKVKVEGNEPEAQKGIASWVKESIFCCLYPHAPDDGELWANENMRKIILSAAVPVPVL